MPGVRNPLGFSPALVLLAAFQLLAGIPRAAADGQAACNSAYTKWQVLRYTGNCVNGLLAGDVDVLFREPNGDQQRWLGWFSGGKAIGSFLRVVPNKQGGLVYALSFANSSGDSMIDYQFINQRDREDDRSPDAVEYQSRWVTGGPLPAGGNASRGWYTPEFVAAYHNAARRELLPFNAGMDPRQLLAVALRRPPTFAEPVDLNATQPVIAPSIGDNLRPFPVVVGEHVCGMLEIGNAITTIDPLARERNPESAGYPARHAWSGVCARRGRWSPLGWLFGPGVRQGEESNFSLRDDVVAKVSLSEWREDGRQLGPFSGTLQVVTVDSSRGDRFLWNAKVDGYEWEGARFLTSVPLADPDMPRPELVFIKQQDYRQSRTVAMGFCGLPVAEEGKKNPEFVPDAFCIYEVSFRAPATSIMRRSEVCGRYAGATKEAVSASRRVAWQQCRQVYEARVAPMRASMQALIDSSRAAMEARRAAAVPRHAAMLRQQQSMNEEKVRFGELESKYRKAAAVAERNAQRDADRIPANAGRRPVRSPNIDALTSLIR